VYLQEQLPVVSASEVDQELDSLPVMLACGGQDVDGDDE
jgi:hypothetical protein